MKTAPEATGLRSGSNTDIVAETVERLGAVQAFRANVRTLQAEDELTSSLLDIKA
ncbi:MAG: hypothetical protein OXU20_21135 [Myxococcales bacterium]|nr:hypothetical protein [Myxococcales bacterium]MDD9965480.1 hypothetical protein [Myxococcales bacterium]